jgi:hypothetical protein
MSIIDTNNLDLPFNIPKDICPRTSTIDNYYLEKLLPSLNPLDPVHDFSEISTFCEEFANEHNNIIIYSPNHNGLWFPSDIAYKNIEFIDERHCFRGIPQYIKENNLFISQQRKPSHFLHLNPKNGATLIPYVINDDIKGIAIGQLVANNPIHYTVELAIGNNYNPHNLNMPFFE